MHRLRGVYMDKSGISQEFFSLCIGTKHPHPGTPPYKHIEIYQKQMPHFTVIGQA